MLTIVLAQGTRRRPMADNSLLKVKVALQVPATYAALPVLR